MKQIVLITFMLGLTFACANKERNATAFKHEISFAQNIYKAGYDEVTGWIRVLLKEPELWGFIDKDSNVMIPFVYKFLNSFDSAGMVWGQIDEKRGYINTHGDTVISFIYDDLSSFNWGFARAVLNGWSGFINRKGETVIPFEYDQVHSFLDCGVAPVSIGDKWGVINARGEIIVPLIYQEIDYHTKDTLLFVRKNRKWAIFTHRGEQMSEFIYDEIYGAFQIDYYNPDYLFNGLLLVRSGRQFRYFNRNLEIVADFGHYSKATPVSQYGYAIVRKGSGYGIINSKGEIVVPCNYPKIENPAMEYQGYFDEFYIHLNGKVGLLSKEARPITDIVFSSINSNPCFVDGKHHNLYVVRQKKKCGLVDGRGQMILPLEYDSIEQFESNHCAIAKKNGMYGIINYKGLTKVSFEYTNIETCRRCNHYIINKNGRFGVIRKETFQTLIPAKYDGVEVCCYDENRFIVKLNGKYGIIDIDQKIIIPIKYDRISNWVEFGPREHFVERNGKEGLIGRDGKIVIPVIYDQIYVDNKTLIKVMKDGAFGTVDWQNRIVHPIQYEQILWEWPYLTGRRLDTVFLKKSGGYFATDTLGNVIVESVPIKTIDNKFRHLLRKP